jgi:hypothetical protein
MPTLNRAFPRCAAPQRAARPQEPLGLLQAQERADVPPPCLGVPSEQPPSGHRQQQDAEPELWEQPLLDAPPSGPPSRAPQPEMRQWGVATGA